MSGYDSTPPFIAGGVPDRGGGHVMTRRGGLWARWQTGEQHRTVTNVLLAVTGLLFVWPMIWVFSAAFDLNPDWNVTWPSWTTLNFSAVLTGSYARALLNSAELGLIAMLVATVPAIPAGYALARRNIPFRHALMVSILFLTVVPIGIVIIPLFEAFAKYNLLSIIPAGIFLGATSLPFAIWLIANGMRSIPSEIEEAAIAESANLWQRGIRIILPLSAPSIASAAFLSFINGWGALLVPLVIIQSPSQQPAPLALYTFVHGPGVTLYGEIAAFSLLFSLPVIILYLSMSRFVSGGFALAGSLHG